MAGTYTTEQQKLKLLADKEEKQQMDFANQQSLVYVSLLSKLAKGEVSQKTFLDQSNIIHDSLDNYKADAFTKTFFAGIENGLPTVTFPDQSHRDNVIQGYSELKTYLEKNPSNSKDGFQSFSENIVNSLVTPNPSAPGNIIPFPSQESGKTSSWFSIPTMILIGMGLVAGFIIWKIIKRKDNI